MITPATVALLSEGIDAAVKLITLYANSTGAQSTVSSIIAARIADGGRDWTDAERQAITDAIDKAHAYAKQQAAIPDAPAAP